MNNLSDCASNIVTIAGSKLSAKPRDKEHPFGHGRLVYISALVVSAIIFLMGFELAKTSVGKIIHPSEVKLSLLSTVILIISVCIKLWMAYFNNRLYKVSKSSRHRQSERLHSHRGDNAVADYLAFHKILSNRRHNRLMRRRHSILVRCEYGERHTRSALRSTAV